MVIRRNNNYRDLSSSKKDRNANLSKKNSSGVNASRVKKQSRLKNFIRKDSGEQVENFYAGQEKKKRTVLIERDGKMVRVSLRVYKKQKNSDVRKKKYKKKTPRR